MKNIVIIGGGAAGLSAAVTAAQGSASVTVLEKRKYLCGNGRYAEGVFAAGSRLQKRSNIDADPAVLFRQAMEYAHWRSDARLTAALIGHSGETVDWLCELGVPFSRILHHMPNQSPAVFHMAYPAPTGLQVTRVLQETAEKLGVTAYTEADVKALVSAPDGSICGVTAVIGGSEKTFSADAVLICTGGFAGNHELMREMIPGCDPEAFMHLKGIPMQGDGLQLARAAGADIVCDIAIEGCGPVYGGRGEIVGLIRRADCLWVNALGERFCDESIAADFVFGQNAVARQPGRMCWAVMDSDYIRRVKNDVPNMMADPASDDNGMAQLDAALEQEIGKGGILRADSIEDLARMMGVPADTLCAEIAAYNDACEHGCDPLFFKERRMLRPVVNGPFYAVRAGLDMITTHGGIRTDSRMRVLDADRAPIGNLYAAGIDISGVDSADYSVTLSGHAFGFALTGGRLAASEMLKG